VLVLTLLLRASSDTYCHCHTLPLMKLCILNTTCEVHARPCVANSASMLMFYLVSHEVCNALNDSAMPCVNLLDVTCLFWHSACVLLPTLVVPRYLWRCDRIHSLVVIVSTPLTARIATCCTRTHQTTHCMYTTIYNVPNNSSLIVARRTRAAAVTRTRTNTNPNDTEANAAGRSVRACVARKSKS